MTYVKDPMFWFAVILVAVAVNYAWNFFTKRGKLV